jgi:transcriptional regulator with XRE-family HTH domain
MDKNPLLKRVGEKIRAKREQEGFSQEEFAGKIGIDRAYYGRVERGEVNISLLKLSNIAEELKINIVALLED